MELPDVVYEGSYLGYIVDYVYNCCLVGSVLLDVCIANVTTTVVYLLIIVYRLQRSYLIRQLLSFHLFRIFNFLPSYWQYNWCVM